jgi:FkbM family methyltransferase
MLPDGRAISCVNPHNAAGVWHELAGSIDSWRASDLRPGDAVIDLGAHIGLASLYLADITGGSLRTIACEPAPPSYACLLDNFSRYLPDGISLNTAVGAETGTAMLSYYPHIETMSTIHVDDTDDRRNVDVALTEFGIRDADERATYWELARAGVEVYPVPVTTVSKLLADYSTGEVSLLKVDVERAEMDVFRGIADSDWQAIRNVVVEVHDIDGRLAEVVALLGQRGFDVDHFQPKILAGATVHMVVANRRYRS